MSAHLRIVSPLDTRLENPRRGLRRAEGPKSKPRPHPFAVIGYSIWIGGVQRRRMLAYRNTFVELEP